jgi:DNA-binding CsgD family transcriptional regulator
LARYLHPNPGPDETEGTVLEGFSPTVMGTLDPNWRVRRISVEVTDVLGFALEDCVGVPVLDAVHPMDAPTALSHMTSLALNEAAVALHLRVRKRPHGWQLSRVVLCSLIDSKSSPFAFSLTPLDALPAPAPAPPVPGPEASRVRELEFRLRRVAAEVRAAGITLFPVAPGDSRDLDLLAELSPRQHDILQRLVAGQRTPAIARDLFLSQNTVRNHLSAIFRRFGVHSQSQLLERVKSLQSSSTATAENPRPIETDRL